MSGRYFSLMIWSFSPTSKSAELTLSSDLALNFLTRQQGISHAYPSNSRCLVTIPKNVGTKPINGDRGFYLWAPARRYYISKEHLLVLSSIGSYLRGFGLFHKDYNL